MPFTRLTNIPIEGEQKNRFIWKLSGLLIFGSFFSGIFGYSLKLLFLHQLAYWSLLLSFVFLLIIIFLENISIKKSKWAFLVIICQWLSLNTAFNFDNLSVKALINGQFWLGSSLVLLLFLYSWQRGQSAIGQMIKIKFFHLSKAIMPSAIAALFFFTSVAYVYGINNGGFISSQDFRILFNYTASLTDKFYPGLNLSSDSSSVSTANDLIKKIALSQAEQNPQFSLLSDSMKKQFLNSAVEEINKKISAGIGEKINTAAPAADAVYEILKNKLAFLADINKLLISLLLLFLFFLSLESIAWLVRWILSPFLFIIYELLIAMDFLKMEYEGVSKENINL